MSVMLIQRIFRGHKGRESGDVERRLKELEAQIKPLVVRLKELEERIDTDGVVLRRLEGSDKRAEQDMKDLEVEFLHCLETTAKFTDCDKINGIPQRYLTKYLRIRLKDHYDHENEVFLQRREELHAKKIEFREIEKEAAAVKRELVPLTTGLVVHAKKERSARLRAIVRRKRKMATRIQALWRGAIVRVAFNDLDRDYWIQCFDAEQGEDPYYYNTITHQTTWTKGGPWCWRLFVSRYPERDN